MKNATDVSLLKRISQQTFLTPKFVIDIILWYNLGRNRARNLKWASHFALFRFSNYSRDFYLNSTPLGPLITTYIFVKC